MCIPCINAVPKSIYKICTLQFQVANGTQGHQRIVSNWNLQIFDLPGIYHVYSIYQVYDIKTIPQPEVYDLGICQEYYHIWYMKQAYTGYTQHTQQILGWHMLDIYRVYTRYILFESVAVHTWCIPGIHLVYTMILLTRFLRRC